VLIDAQKHIMQVN